MKRSKRQKEAPLHRPFGELKTLLKNRKLKKDPGPVAPQAPPPADPADSEDEEEIFQRAMADVVPLHRGGCLPFPGAVPDKRETLVSSADESLRRLECLIRDGKGFVVSQTPEYMEGMGPSVCPEIAARLHRGHFSIEAHIDLHGQTAAEAEESFNHFLQESTRLGRRAVLVIHGRGLSSPDMPVLKNRVQKWLSAGFWRKWVVAYCSARLCDGGAGATYVLLRSRPLTKKQRKTEKI